MTLFDYLLTNLVELAPGRCTSRADNSMALNIRRILGEPRRKGDLTDPCSRRWVFLSEGIQKFLFPDFLGVGRFVKIGIPWPQFTAPFVGVVETACGSLLLVGAVVGLMTPALDHIPFTA